MTSAGFVHLGLLSMQMVDSRPDPKPPPTQVIYLDVEKLIEDIEDAPVPAFDDDPPPNPITAPDLADLKPPDPLDAPALAPPPQPTAEEMALAAPEPPAASAEPAARLTPVMPTPDVETMLSLPSPLQRPQPLADPQPAQHLDASIPEREVITEPSAPDPAPAIPEMPSMQAVKPQSTPPSPAMEIAGIAVQAAPDEVDDARSLEIAFPPAPNMAPPEPVAVPSPAPTAPSMTAVRSVPAPAVPREPALAPVEPATSPEPALADTGISEAADLEGLEQVAMGEPKAATAPPPALTAPSRSAQVSMPARSAVPADPLPTAPGPAPNAPQATVAPPPLLPPEPPQTVRAGPIDDASAVALTPLTPPALVSALAMPPQPPSSPPPAEPVGPSFDSILNQVDDLAEILEPELSGRRESAPVDPVAQAASADQPLLHAATLTQSEIDAIRSQIERNWSPPVATRAKDPPIISVRLNLDPDGRIIALDLIDNVRARSVPGYRALADSTLRAVRLTGVIRNLPSEKYHQWREIIVRFDPDQIGR